MNRDVYTAMWGPTDFVATGATRDYDRTPDLHRLTMPVLFLTGRYDTATPETTALYQSLVPGAELVVFEESSHTPHLEEPDAFLAAVRPFLRRAETCSAALTSACPDQAQRTAMGFTGEPVPPTTTSGAIVSRNSQRPASAQAWASSSKSALSNNVSPMYGIAIEWIGRAGAP